MKINRTSFLLTSSAACLALASTMAVADVTAYAVGRVANYTQTSNAAPVTADVWNILSVLVSDVGHEVIASDMSLDVPPPVTYPLGESLPTLWQFSSIYYTDYDQFIHDFPATTYTFTADRGLGLESGDVFIPEDWYCPEIPYFTGDTFTRLQSIDTTLSFVGSMNGFTLAAGTEEGFISIVVVEDGAAGACMSISLNPDETTFEIPVGILEPDKGYTIGLTYLNQLRIPGAGFAGTAMSGAEFYRATGASFHTRSLAPPCIADFNHDGVVDFFDYLDFVAAFSAGC